MNAAAETTPSLQKEWWLRTFGIFHRPRMVFAGLRDDSAEAVEARQEPLLATITLAGIAAVLSTSLAGRVLDDPVFSNSVLAVLSWAFLGGLVYGTVVYWFGGLLVHALASALRAGSSYRQARHVLGFASAPLALSLLLVWPVRLAIYGDDVFRSGGSDTGTGDVLFDLLILATYVWTFGLVALGRLELRNRSSSSPGIS
ncbi:MAG TPA: YIP1 family protein [Gaiellaceae bacterium]|nr:YIP1 family protein [Gaiellaceae bacterium]